MLNRTLKLNEKLFTKGVKLVSTRDGFGKGILEAGESNGGIVVLSADLTDSVRVRKFADKFPERFFEVGIAEQNMASIAAGLALSGKIPFIISHAIFSPSTNWAQIRLGAAFSNTNVKIVGSHQGLSNAPDGGIAESLEDVALMRVLPNMVILNPIDSIQTEKAVLAAIKHKGPVYLRLNKAPTPTITTGETPFTIGKAQIPVTGNGITLISHGPITAEVLFAARFLKEKHNISAEVIACPTIKPLDEKTILQSAKKTGRVVVIEEHQIIGGLGSAICELLSEKQPLPVTRIGMNDEFGQSGTYQQLKHHYKLDATGIAQRVVKLIK